MLQRKIFFVNYAVTDYDGAADQIIEHARQRRSFGVSALAVHGLVETVKDQHFRACVSKLELVVPDGQPIKWALNSFYKTNLKNRVAGPILTKHVLQKANEYHLKIFLYGSTRDTLDKMQRYMRVHYPNLEVCGIHPDRFREATAEEDAADIERINGSGANLVLVGRGCPRQERWVANHLGKVQAPMMAVGAAFDFMAGNINHAPVWMQRIGMEWFYRLCQDPKKLWKRYLTTNFHFLYLILLCKLGLRKVQF